MNSQFTIGVTLGEQSSKWGTKWKITSFRVVSPIYTKGKWKKTKKKNLGTQLGYEKQNSQHGVLYKIARFVS